MDDFTASASKPNFRMKLRRGERMCLIGFDVDAPEPDLVGFAIECKPPGAKRISPLLNRLAFSCDGPIAKAVTGDRSSGESGNGDHLLMIEDAKIATAYAIEALRVFDHLHLRSTLQKTTGMTAAAKKAALTLRKPRAISGKVAWFEAYCVVGSQKMKDRQLFAS